MRIEISPIAGQDLEHIGNDYAKQSGKELAGRFRQALRRFLEFVAASGCARQDIAALRERNVSDLRKPSSS